MSKYVLITGASNGIGRACAKIMAKKGYNLIITARNEARLEELQQALMNDYHVDVKVFVKDLSRDNALSLYEDVKQAGLEVSHLINNAGFGDHGDYLSSDFRVQKDMVMVNILALMELSYLFGQDMVARDEGHILNVASIAGLCAGPYMSVYYATKAFVISFSDALARELSHTHVKVTCLCPGPTSTGFMERAHLGASPMFKLFKPASAEAVADLGIKSMLKGRTLVIHGLGGHALNVATRLLPRVIVEKSTAYVNGKRTIA